MDSCSSKSLFVSDWVKQNRQPIRKCRCGGSVYWCRTEFKGDADWAIHQCDVCGAGWESAGHWTYQIPMQKCPGIEIEPGVYSGCTAAQTGATDCPVCGPMIAAERGIK